MRFIYRAVYFNLVYLTVRFIYLAAYLSCGLFIALFTYSVVIYHPIDLYRGVSIARFIFHAVCSSHGLFFVVFI